MEFPSAKERLLDPGKLPNWSGSRRSLMKAGLILSAGLTLTARCSFAWGGASSSAFGAEPAVLIEELLRLITAHPALEQLQMLGIHPWFGKRYLVGPIGSLDG